MTTAAIITQLEAQRDALGQLPEFPTDREHATYRRSYDGIQRVISQLRDLPTQLARIQTRLDEQTAHSAAYLAKQADLERQLAADPDAPLPALQLEKLRDGTLLVGPGTTLGSLGYIESRIAELTARRDGLQSQLDAHLQQAEALLAAQVKTEELLDVAGPAA